MFSMIVGCLLLKHVCLRKQLILVFIYGIQLLNQNTKQRQKKT